jgi:hypothetical protein
MRWHAVQPGYTLRTYTESEWQACGARVYSTDHCGCRADKDPDAREARIVRLMWRYEAIGLVQPCSSEVQRHASDAY